MNETLSNYLTESQFNRICKYWSIMDSLRYKIKHFDWSNFQTWDECWDDDYTIRKGMCKNEKLYRQIKEVRDKLEYYESEYEAYITRLGFDMKDRTQDDVLINFLVNGVVLDT